VVGEHHDVLQARRQEMKTDAFTGLMNRRAAVEGTISELVRAHGLRRARYRGLKKVALQNWLTGAACNVKRWLRRTVWEMEVVTA
jgi:transposase